MSIEIDCHGESHIGQVRQENEDQFFIADLNKSMRIHETSLGLSDHSRMYGGSQGKLMLVADGLGGYEGGERASTLAVDGISNYVLNTMDWCFGLNIENDAYFLNELEKAFTHSQEMIDAEAEAIPQRRGMATTLTMAYIHWPNAYVVHVGDTRCYLVRDQSIQQLTTDHTVAELARSVSPQKGNEKAETSSGNSPMDHALWNVVGGPKHEMHPQVQKLTLSKGDALLLCSDGLTRHLTDEELLAGILQEKSSTEICKQFVELANSRGGRDNITAVLAKIDDSNTRMDSTVELKAISPDDFDSESEAVELPKNAADKKKADDKKKVDDKQKVAKPV